MDWSKCALCQGDDVRDLIDPMQNKDPEICGYSKLAVNIEAFVEESLPLPRKVTVPICDLKGECGIVENLLQMHAKWHKHCALEVTSSRLQRAKYARDRNDKKSQAETPAKKTRAVISAKSPLGSAICLFCDQPGIFKKEETSMAEIQKWGKDARDKLLHRVTSFNRDSNIRETATQMGDTKILAKLSEGDLIAREACYHGKCMTAFRNRYMLFDNQRRNVKLTQKKMESIALAETMIFIDETLQSTEAEVIAPFVKLSTVRKFYCESLEKLDASFVTVNATRLKESILRLNSNLEASSSKKEVYISYKDSLAAALQYSNEHSVESEAAYLSKAANIIRQDVLGKKFEFTGTFSRDCQSESVPSSLLSFVHMLTGYPSNATDGDTECLTNVPALSIAQLIQFNSVSERRKVGQFRHNADKETPLSIYIAFLLHSRTRSRILIDKFYDLGLCISYHRMLTLSTALGNSVCEQFKQDGLVCPPKLRSNIFTTYAVDNIDHNPSSRTAKDSWHGTALSGTQHLEDENDGVTRPPLQLIKSSTKSLRQLPASYTTIHPYVLKTTDVFAPLRHPTSDENVNACLVNDSIISVENQWLERVMASV